MPEFTKVTPVETYEELLIPVAIIDPVIEGGITEIARARFVLTPFFHRQLKYIFLDAVKGPTTFEPLIGVADGL